MKIAKPAIILALLVITAVSWITTDAKYMNVQYLQHLGTLLLMLLLVHGTIKEPMPISAFTCLTIFIFIHIIGARYCYSNVPYAEWFAKLGVVVHNSRNHFDRLVHFSFGVLLFPYLQHKCSSWIEKKPPISIFGAWLLIQTGSMIYELFEWQLAFSIAPKDAETYNGQQGDMWDAQKDMALAMLGSTIMAIYYLFKSKLDIKGQKTDINKTTVVSIVCLIMLGSSGCLSYSHYCYSKRAMAAQVLPEGKNAKPGRIYFASFPENKLALDIWGWHPNVGHAALVTRNNVGLIKQYDYG